MRKGKRKTQSKSISSKPFLYAFVPSWSKRNVQDVSERSLEYSDHCFLCISHWWRVIPGGANSSLFLDYTCVCVGEPHIIKEGLCDVKQEEWVPGVG